MAGKLYVIRHGKTDWNEQCKLQGNTDIPLNEKGRAQAREAAAEYKDVNFDICYCSPLQRARETMEILLEGRDIPVIIDERLREMNFGTYEGTRINDFGEDLMRRFIDTEFSDIGGECRADVYRRLKVLLAEIIDGADDGDNVLLVSHGGLYLSLMNMLFALDGEKLRERAGDKNPTPNLGYAVFTYENGKFILKKTMEE